MEPKQQVVMAKSKSSSQRPRPNVFEMRSLVRNPFEEEKRRLEEKKKREEAEQAAVYESFVSSFEGGPDSSSSGRSFVRAGEATRRRTGLDGPADQPAQIPPVEAGPLRKQKKTKNIDLFLEELKKEAEQDRRERPSRPPVQSTPRGSHADDGDVQSTNLYVGNLAPSVNETMLLLEFGKYGPIGSVKVMWPRSSEEAARSTSSKCGFVSFMRREDAADALRELQGYVLEGQPLRMNWGKAVPQPAEALPMPPMSTINHAADIAAPNLDLTFTVSKDHCKINVVIPVDRDERARLDLAAQYTAKHGVVFERALMEEKPEWRFLFDRSSTGHVYYRWKVYSLSQGDTMDVWRTAPFAMTCHGPLWVPPPLGQPDESAPSSDGAKSKSSLSRSNQEKLHDLLSSLSTDRYRIAMAMAFALDHADHSADVAAEIEARLMRGDEKEPIPHAIALLYLVSDVLHNSSSATVRNAWNYRTQFQNRLDAMFDRLHEVYAAIDGRLSAEHMKERVVRVLRVWHSWSLYPSEFIEQLEEKFVGKAPPTPLQEEVDIDGEALGLDSDDEDIDGEPLDLI